MKEAAGRDYLKDWEHPTLAKDRRMRLPSKRQGLDASIVREIRAVA